MFAPTGPEPQELRRIPMISLGVLALMGVSYLVFLILPEPDLLRVRQAIHMAGSQPRLQPDPLLGRMVALNRHLVKPVIRSGENLPVEQRQEKLEALQSQALALWRASPAVRWGLTPGEFSISQLLSFSWVQHSALFLFGWAVLLYTCGPLLEDRWGRPFFLGFLLVANGLPALLFLLVYRHSWIPVTGLMSMTAAVVGAFNVRFPQMRVELPAPLPIGFSGVLPVSITLLMPLWLLLQYGYIKFQIVTEQISYGFAPLWLSVWGYLFGCGLAWVLRLFDLEKRIHLNEFERQPLPVRLRYNIDRALHENETEKALALLEQAYETSPDEEVFRQQFWEQAVRMDQTVRARKAGAELFEKGLEQGHFSDSFLHWRELVRVAPDRVLGFGQISTLVRGLKAEDCPMETEEVLAFVATHLPPQRSDTYVPQLAELAEWLDPSLAFRVLTLLVAHTQADSLERAQAEETLASLKKRQPNSATQDEDSRSLPLAAAEFHPDLLENPFRTTYIQELQIIRAKPVSYAKDGLLLQGDDRVNRLLKYLYIKGLGLAAIREIGSAPFLVLDLLLDDPMIERATHRVMRCHGRRFDPVKFAKPGMKPSEAIRFFVEKLVAQSGAHVLPDQDILPSMKFPSFPSVEDFERQTYGVESLTSGWSTGH